MTVSQHGEYFADECEFGTNPFDVIGREASAKRAATRGPSARIVRRTPYTVYGGYAASPAGSPPVARPKRRTRSRMTK